MTKVIRQDSKERILGNKSYIGDLEVIGKFEVKDSNNKTIFEFDPDEGKLSAYDTSGNVVWQVDTDVGEITEGFAKGDMAYRVDSGPRQWTTNDSWTNINSTNFQIDGDSFLNTDVKFEVLGCVELLGRTASYRIYNVTDAGVLADSAITTVAVSSEGEGWINAELIRSANLTFPSGLKNYRLQMKQNVAGGGGDSTQFFKGALIYINQ